MSGLREKALDNSNKIEEFEQRNADRFKLYMFKVDFQDAVKKLTPNSEFNELKRAVA
jgi:hypothetical protein